MCAIAGIVAFDRAASPGDVARMTELVSYRGPDDFGYVAVDARERQSVPFRQLEELKQEASDYSFDVILGHRRLSIIDLSPAGHGPMSYEGGRYWITYNGEVYNYIELRRELETKGYRFKTQTDTEVIFAAYREWGYDCLTHFNGMWAFALVDLEKGIVFCARDRLGVKPFYYHFDGKRFAFGSEIKQLLVLPGVSRKIHPGVLFDFFAFDTYGCDSEQTFFHDVKDMRGGHYLVIPLGKEPGLWQPAPVAWWDIDLRKKLHGWSDHQYATRYYELFEDAVRLRLRSDVPVGSCLSGGLDSSGIVCAVDKIFKETNVTGLQKTFTATSDNAAFDETDYARAVIDATRVDPSFVLPTPERLLNDLDKLLWHQDEPFVSTSIFAGWCVYGLAREQGVTVTLDGQGPDEMMGGYLPRMYPALLLENLQSGHMGALWNNARGIHHYLGKSHMEIAQSAVREIFRGKAPVMSMPSVRKAAGLFTQDFFEEGLAKSMFLGEMKRFASWKAKVGGNRFDRLLYRFTLHDSLPGILRQVDRNAMAFSIESRLPFLDYRLVEYTFSLPTSQKVANGIAKQVYRRALATLLPEKIRARTSKFGFVTAEQDWLRGAAQGWMRQSLADIKGDSPFNREFAENRFGEFSAGSEGLSTLFWKVACTERVRSRVSTEVLA